MAFNSSDPRSEYTASAAQTVFPYLFKIYTETDIKVYQTPVGQTPDDVTDLLTLTTDYTVTINGDAGGEITLVSGATSGDAVTLLRELDIDRDIEYQTNGDLLAETLNSDQEYQTYLVADQKAAGERNIKLAENAQGVDNYLPAPVADAYIKWNAAANALENDDIIPTNVQLAVDSAAAALVSENAAAADLALTNADVVLTNADVVLAEQAVIDAQNVVANTANLVTVDTTNFDNALSSTDDTVQKALETLDNIASITQSPLFTPTSSSEAEGVPFIITVTNDATYASPVYAVSDVTYVDNGNGTITITPPNHTGVVDVYALDVTCKDGSSPTSEPTVYTLTVQEILADTGIVWASTTLNDTTIPTTPDATITANVLTADADSAVSESIKITSGNTNLNAVVTTINPSSNFTLDGTETNIEATVSGQTLTDGDTILLNDGADVDLVEFNTTGHVTPTSNNIVSSADPFSDGNLVYKMEMEDGNATIGTNPTNTNGVAFTTGDGGKFNEAGIFNASAHFVMPTGVIVATDTFTISAWFKTSSSTRQGIVYNAKDADYGIEIDATGKLQSTIFATASTLSEGLSTNTYDDGAWHNVVLTYDRTTTTMTIDNGAEVVSSTLASGDMRALNRTTAIGGIASTTVVFPFNGNLDQVELYDRVFTTSEINSLYTQTLPVVIDLTTASLTNAPTTIAKDTADISTSLVASAGADTFVARTAQSHTADATSAPTIVTDVFDSDTRQGEDYKVRMTQHDSGDELSSIVTAWDKIV